MITISVKRMQGWYAVTIRCSRSHDLYALVDDLKGYIDARDREYDPGSRSWSIFEEDALRSWLDHCVRQYKASVVGDVGSFKAHSRDRERDDAFRSLHLLDTAPKEVIAAVYKAMALLHHPDRGGDTRRMQEINRAYEILAKEINS